MLFVTMASARFLLVLALTIQISRCDYYYSDDDLQDFGEDAECISGTGRDCLTIVKIVIIASAICIGAALAIGGALAYFFVRGRHSVRGLRIYGCLASCCCCDFPSEEDSLVGVVVDSHDQTATASATGDNPTEMKNDSSDAPKILFSTNDNRTIEVPKPLLSDSQIKAEPVSEEEVEVVARSAEVAPARGQEEAHGDIKREPTSPVTYADAVKANTSSDSSNGGGGDVTDFSTPASDSKRKSRLTKLLKRAFSPSTSPTPQPGDEQAAALLENGEDRKTEPVSPVSQTTESPASPATVIDKDHTTDNQFEIINCQPVEEEEDAEQDPLEQSRASSSRKGSSRKGSPRKPRHSSAKSTHSAGAEVNAGLPDNADVTDNGNEADDVMGETVVTPQTGSRKKATPGTPGNRATPGTGPRSGSRISNLFRSFLSSGTADESRNQDPDETA